MAHVPEIAGPQDPLLVTPPPRPGSVRRTACIDTTRAADGSAEVQASARDLACDRAGTRRVIALQRFVAELDTDATLRSIGCDPIAEETQQLVGRRVGPGFRQVVLDLLPDLQDGGLLAHLLDDWPGAQLVSGYALQRRWMHDDVPPELPREHLAAIADICSGWGADASLMTEIGRTGTMPTPLGPTLRTIDSDEQDGWHELTPLPAGSTRRRRRIDAWLDDERTAGFEAHFRDSYGESRDTQSAVHEYLVSGVVERGSLMISSIDTRALVLPWLECPAAAASSQRLVDEPLAGLRIHVRATFTGTTTCTHLNDTLRTLEDLHVLVPLLPT